MRRYDFEVLILTTVATGTPHLAAMLEANPELVCHVHSMADEASPEAAEHAWRNSDRNLREWWREHAGEVATDRLLAMEWDVFCNVDLAGISPTARERKGLTAPAVMMPIRDRAWTGFREIARFPRELRSGAIGAAPSAVQMLTRALLDEIARPEHDEVFEADIFCELRLPTVARAAGFEVAGWPVWRDVTQTRRTLPEGFQGIAHPIKREVLP